MKSLLAITGLLIAATTAMGCTEVVSSADIRTHGISGTFTVEANNETSSKVYATLQVGGDESNTFVSLDDGDSLRVEANGQNEVMKTIGEGKYEALINTGAADTEYKIVFLRGADDDGAPNNIGTLPKPFEITAVPENKPSRKDDDITLKWSNSGSTDTMDIEIKGDCIFRWHKSGIADNGEYTIPKGDIHSTGGDNPKECTLTIVMKRARAGSPDQHLNPESSFVLYQRRATKFMSAP